MASAAAAAAAYNQNRRVPPTVQIQKVSPNAINILWFYAVKMFSSCRHSRLIRLSVIYYTPRRLGVFLIHACLDLLRPGSSFAYLGVLSVSFWFFVPREPPTRLLPGVQVTLYVVPNVGRGF